MAEDKILDVGGVAELRDAKGDLPTESVDRVNDSELGIPEDVDIERIERVYRYAIYQTFGGPP